MRKVNCEACGASYDVDPRRIPPNGMKMRCPGCGAQVHVAPLPAEGGAPAPRASLNNELDLDLPAPKLPKPPAAIPSGLPPLTSPTKPAGKLPEVELSDLPAVKIKSALSNRAADDLSDLPAPKAHGKAEPTWSAPKAPKFEPPAGEREEDAALPALKSPARPAAKPLAPDFGLGPAKPSLPELDLPAAKPRPLAPSVDLPKSKQFDEDLPVAKGKPTEFGLGAPKPSLPEIDLPAPKVKAPLAPSIDLPAAKAKPRAPEIDLPVAKGKPLTPDFDLPVAKGKPLTPDFDLSGPGKPLGLEIDLPAPKPKTPPTLDIELPAPKAKTPVDADMDLPALKGRPRAPAPDLHAPKAAKLPTGLDFDLEPLSELEVDLPARAGAKPRAPEPAFDLLAPKSPVPPAAPSMPGSFDLDLPLAPAAPVATPKKSFAKPSAASADTRSIPVAPAPAASSGGMLPKDSLAIEPSPFFANTAPLGMFGKLDELEAKQPAPPPDLVDLPAPNDLPVVKKPAPAKATSLGLGTLPKDSLDMPAAFARPSAVLPAVISGSSPSAKNPQPSPFDQLETNARMPALSELDLPAPRDLPAIKQPQAEPMGELDLPAPRDLPALKQPRAEPMGELDLPAPRDLPAIKPAKPAATAFGLGAAAGHKPGFEVQSLSPQALLPSAQHGLALDLPPMGAKSGSELGEFDRALDGLESRGGGSFGALGLDLSLPSPRSRTDTTGSFGDLEPIALPSAGASNTNTLALSTLELAPHELLMGADSSLTKSSLPDLGRELGDFGNSHAHGGSMPSLGSPLSAGAVGGENFGELDLGIGRESQVGLPLAIPSRRTGTTASFEPSPAIEDAELLGEHDDASAKQAKRKKAQGGRPLPGWLLPLGLVAALGAGGTALGMFTHHGYFGVHSLELLLPAAGDPATVATAIEQAERQAKSDAYVDARRALVTLSDARNEAGLNRELLARSLLHEALYQLRFGEDGQSAQRSAGILARVLERGTNVPGLALARAADAARRADLPEAKRLLAEAPREGDRFYGLVAGEIALLEKQWETAVQMFSAAAKQGEVARGQWGIARALLAQNRPDAAEGAAKLTLEASPLHSPAHALMAEQALLRGEIEQALSHARIAAGRVAVSGVQARPSKAERAHAFSLEGRAEEKRDHPREAQASYELALASDPMSVPDLLGSGRMSMRLGRPHDALSRFDSALHAKPSTTPGPDGKTPALEAGIGAVEALLALQRAEEALPRANALLAQAPGDAEVQLWHGHVLEALDRHEDAEADFRAAIEKAPNLFDGYVALSQLLFKRGRPEEAARVLATASGKVKDSAEVRRMLGNSELTRLHIPEAIKQFEAALKFDPKDPGALFGLVVAQRKSGQLDAANATLDRLQKADPTFPGLSLERGQLLETRGQYEAAAEVYRAALKQRPTDSDLKLRLGAALVTAGKVDEAESVLDAVLKERPTSAEAEHYLGRVLFARKETALAVQRFERAVNFDMRQPEYHLYLAWALLEQGDYGGALESVQRAIQRDPNLGDARWILGRIQLRTGAVKDALVNFQAALRLKPGRVEALANMGDAYDELRDLSAAIKSYQEALKKAPDNAEWWYRLGQLELDKGQRDAARASLAEAVMRGDRSSERPSWLAEAHRSYGDILRESKRASDAVEHYKLFLEMAPLGHPDRREIEQLVYQLRH